MADQETGKADQQSEAKLPRPFPPFNFPTLYADGFLNFTNSGEVTKFYLFRNEPSLAGDNTSAISPVLQIVMPTSAFLATVIGMPQLLDNLSMRSPEMRELINSIKQQYGGEKQENANDPRT